MKPIVVVIDTREQEPYAFDPKRVVAVRRKLPAGDYSLEGFERSIAIERKSLDDFVSTIVSHRERFERELRLLASYDLSCVVVEGSAADILAHRYRSAIAPAAVLARAVSIFVEDRVPVFLCGTRQIACWHVQELLLRYFRKATTSCKESTNPARSS